METNNCSICSKNINLNVNSSVLLCGHKFHSNCMMQWVIKLTQLNYEVCCPICDYNVLLSDEIEDNCSNFLKNYNMKYKLPENMIERKLCGHNCSTSRLKKCCKCMDKRPHAQNYYYRDGRSYLPCDRKEHYCPVCKIG